MKRKYIAPLCVVAMSATMFAGCASKKTESKPTVTSTPEPTSTEVETKEEDKKETTDAASTVAISDLAGFWSSEDKNTIISVDTSTDDATLTLIDASGAFLFGQLSLDGTKATVSDVTFEVSLKGDALTLASDEITFEVNKCTEDEFNANYEALTELFANMMGSETSGEIANEEPATEVEIETTTTSKFDGKWEDKESGISYSFENGMLDWVEGTNYHMSSFWLTDDDKLEIYGDAVYEYTLDGSTLTLKNTTTGSTQTLIKK